MLHEHPLLFLVRIKCNEEIFFYFGMWYNKIKISKSKEKTMRLLFNMDANDYDKNGRAFVRHSARCITIRETEEEAGLVIVPESIQEFGYVHRVEKSDHMDADYFVQDNFYYLCEVQKAKTSQKLDDYEADEHFTLEWVEPDKAIVVNRTVDHGPKEQNMLEREARVLEILKAEGYLK